MNNPNLKPPLLMGNTGIVKKRPLWFPREQREQDLFGFFEQKAVFKQRIAFEWGRV